MFALETDIQWFGEEVEEEVETVWWVEKKKKAQRSVQFGETEGGDSVNY